MTNAGLPVLSRRRGLSVHGSLRGLLLVLAAVSVPSGSAHAGEPVVTAFADASPPRGARSATLAGGTAARSAEGASTARGGTPSSPNDSPSYDVLGNLGTAELRLGKMRDAAEHLGHSLAIFPVVGKPEAKRVTEELFAKAVVNVGTIRLKVSPTQARVKVGDRAYGADDYREQVFVEPGDVLVSAGDVVGYASEQKSVHVDKGKTVDVEFALKTTAGAPTTSASASATASVAPTGTVAAPGPSLGILIAGGAVTLASLAAGIGLVVAAESNKADAVKLRQSLIDKKVFGLCETDKSDPDCQRFFDAGNLGQTLGNAGAPLLIGAGVVGVATAIYYFAARPKKAPPVSAGASVGPNGAAFSLHGNF